MIVRILSEGQFDVPDDTLSELNRLDDELTAAVDSGDEEAFRQSLSELLSCVRDNGSPEPDDFLAPSDLVLPAEDATIDDVRELLTEEGLVPD
jgi:hypothetical protein